MKISVVWKRICKIFFILSLLLPVLPLIPSASAAVPLWSDGFENGFNEWTTVYGTPSVSTVQRHEGSNSYILNEERDEIKKTWTSAWTNKVLSVWFYDNAADNSMQAETVVQEKAYLGVRTLTSTLNYAYKLGGNAWTESSVPRTTGWHQFVWDMRSGTSCVLYIDGIQVASTSLVTSFTVLRIGDDTNDGRSGTVYIDDISILDELPLTVSLNKTEGTVIEGSTDTLVATVAPSTASQSVIWSTSNSSVATVSGGVISGVSPGIATITATSSVDSSYFASYTVTVEALHPPVGGVHLNKGTTSIMKGSTDSLTATATPALADQDVVWSTSDSSVATVANGVVTAVDVGIATLTATSVSNAVYTASTFVAVTSPLSGTSDVLLQYPVPGFVQPADNYTVKVNGQPVIVQKTIEGGYAHFAFSGTADITVTVADASDFDDDWTLSPESYEIATTQSGRDISFSIDRPMQLLLQKDKSYHYDAPYADAASAKAASDADVSDRIRDKLYLIADPLEDRDTPQLGDANVVNVLDYGIDNTGGVSVSDAVYSALSLATADSKILYFPPGVYNWRKTVYVPDHAKIYLAGGAYLFLDTDALPIVDGKIQFTGFFAVGGKSDVKIYGRGTLFGNNHARPDGLYFRTAAINGINESKAEALSDDVTIEGITITEFSGLPASIRGSNTTIRNVKAILAARTHFDPVGNGRDRTEGYNFQGGSSNVLVENSLIVGEDDGINFSNSIGRELPNDGLTVRNTIIINGSTGSPIKVIDPYGGYIRNIAFDNVDVPYADRAVSIYSWPSKNAGDIYDVYFKGYRVEEISYKTGNEFFGIKDSAQSATPPIVVGPLHDMYFQNTEVARISDYPTPQKLWLYGYNNNAKTEDIHFYNLKINGQTVTETNKLTTGKVNASMPYTANITFEENDPNVVSIEATDPYAGSTLLDTGEFTVSRTGSTTASLTLHYQIRGSAMNGTDFTTITDSITIPAGQSSAAISINPLLLGSGEAKSVYLSLLGSGYNHAYTLAPKSEAVVTLAP